MKNAILLFFLLWIFSCEKERKNNISKNDTTITAIDSAAVNIDSSNIGNSKQNEMQYKEPKDLDWKILNDKNKIPEQISDYFKAAENKTLYIANPDEKFNITDNVMNPDLPFRQLRLLEHKNHIWRMVYIQGGIGNSYQFYEFKIQADTISEIKKGYSFEKY